MDITINKKDPANASIKIILNEADYQPNVEQKIKDYGKKANIKGFRPGKVPTSYIKRLYGKSILVEEINQLLSKSLNDYIKENDLKILGEPLPHQDKAEAIDWNHAKEFEFEYDLGLVDEFKLDLSDKVKIEKYLIEVDKKAMDETMKNVQEQYGLTETVVESEAGDTLEGTLISGDEELQERVVLPINDLDKKVQKKFTGLKAKDEVKIDLKKDFASDEARSRFIGQNASEDVDPTSEYTFKVLEIKRTNPAEINQELFDKVFGKDKVKSEEEFKEKVKETISENYNRETENLLNRDIQNTLVEKTKIDLPDAFLKKWLLLSNQGKITQEQIEKEYDIYAKDLRWNLIKNKISDDNKEIKVEHEDVMNHTKNLIKEQFGAYGMSDQLDANLDSFANNYLQGEKGENYRKVFEELLNLKVMDFVKSQVNIKEKKVDLDGFKKAVEKN